MTNTDLRTNPAASTTTLEVFNEFVGIHVKAEDITVDVNPSAFRPTHRIGVDTGFFKQQFDILFIDGLRNVNHLRRVLHQATILTLRRFVGTQTAPLCGVQVTCLEVRLAANKRACHTAHV